MTSAVHEETDIDVTVEAFDDLIRELVVARALRQMELGLAAQGWKGEPAAFRSLWSHDPDVSILELWADSGVPDSIDAGLAGRAPRSAQVIIRKKAATRAALHAS